VELADMRNGEVPLRLSIVLSVVGFIALAAALYEIDRREKSSSATGDRNLVEMEQRIETLSNQIHVLSGQLTTSERQIQAVGGQVQALTDQYNSRLTTSERQIQFFISRYDARLKELEDDLRVRRLESAPAPR
jgi:septal ring factor EnvC (AmiA/AmiB activator)